MKLEVKRRFYDKVEGIYVEKEVDGKPNIIKREEARGKELIAAGVAVEVPEKIEVSKKTEEAAEPTEEKPKKTRKSNKAE